MGFSRRAAVNGLLKLLLDRLCRIDHREFTGALSRYGPLIIACNHINFLEVPILVSHSYPRLVTGLVKSETWNNPALAFLCNTYRAIPIERGGAFAGAFEKVRRALEQGFCVCIAPEGRRSGSGVLRKGKAGIIQLAWYTGAAILPVAHFGGQHIWENLRRFRRTSFCFKAGRPFTIAFNGRPNHTEREAMLGEVMGQVARLLPPEMRGVYAEQAERGCRYLRFTDTGGGG